MCPKLSLETQRRIDVMYPSEQRAEVTQLLVEEFGPDHERMCFAALKVSNGDIEVLKKAINLGKEDFRDLLAAAGFAWSISKHKSWLPKGIGPQKEDWWTRRRKSRLGL
jgi:hypothetical protein